MGEGSIQHCTFQSHFLVNYRKVEFHSNIGSSIRKLIRDFSALYSLHKLMFILCTMSSFGKEPLRKIQRYVKEGQEEKTKCSMLCNLVWSKVVERRKYELLTVY